MATGADERKLGSGHGLRVLLVFCHPRQDSYCAAVRDRSIAALQQAGHMVELLDLYERAFSPALQAEEHRRYPDSVGRVSRNTSLYCNLVVWSAGHAEGVV
jgi:putative NADPH-quinone reductase